MPYQKTVISNITRNTRSASGATFNFPIFVAGHAYFKERVRVYADWDGFKGDTDITVNSNTYNAVKLAFSQQPAPSLVYIGRRAIDSMTITPQDAVVGDSYGFTIVTYDESTGEVVDSQVVVDFTATSTDIDDVTAGMEADLPESPTGYAVVDSGTELTITPTAGHILVVNSFVNCDDAYVATEAPADILAAVQDESNDWYFLTAEDHTEAFILAMASEIEATNGSVYKKQYWTSTQDAAVLTPPATPATDVIGKLQNFGYDRTNIQWHNTADTTFPEIGVVAANATYQPGGFTFEFTENSTVETAKDPVSGAELSDTKKGYITDKNGSIYAQERGIRMFRYSHMTSGEWADIIHGSDWLNDLIEREVLSFMANQRGSKVDYTDDGMRRVASIVDKQLSLAQQVRFLSGYIPTTFPAYSDIPLANKTGRILDALNWTGYIAGAIHRVIVNGNLTYADAGLE